MIRWRDNAVPKALDLRARALVSTFSDVEVPGDATYKRVCVVPIPELDDAVQALVGRPVRSLGTAFRLNYNGELPNSMVHCDRGYGLLAAVLYLCDGVGGTAFWTHATTGRRAYTGSPDDPCLKDISDDGAWHLRRVVDLKFNRLVVYPTAMWHSRFPRPAWGNCPHSGRLIAIGFY